MKKTIGIALLCLTMLVSSLTILPSFGQDTTIGTIGGDGGDPGPGTGPGGEVLFDKEHVSTVRCQSTEWKTISYYNGSGDLVGTSMWQGGVAKVTYTGQWATCETASGGVAAHNGTAIACYEWGTWCRPVSAVQACQ